jgi:NAD+ synthase (glutamine-hydrolysing)
MRIALAQLNYHIGNFEENVRKIKLALLEAESQSVDIVVFAELSVSGYPPRDFLEFPDFINRCYQAVDEIALACTKVAAVVGAPRINPGEKGKPLFNSALFLWNGQVLGCQHKTLLPNYDVFDEYRYFEPNHQFDIVHFKGERLALTICEDLWNIGDDPLYTIQPLDKLIAHQPTLIINIAASPFHHQQAEIRKDVLKRNAVKYKLPIVYVNHVGAQTELVFDGGSLAMNPLGELVGELQSFSEDFRIFDLSVLQSIDTVFVSHPVLPPVQRIHDALVLGIKDYFGKMGFSKAILGLSGGIDSAVTLVLAAKALGSQNVYAVLLPSRYSTAHSIDDAIQLANNLGVKYDVVSIESSFMAFENVLAPLFADKPHDLTEENLQARIRAVILMALSNKFGYILLNTSNKSEAAVGYGTLYGDMCGGLSVIGDVYKTDVYALARYMNRKKEVIPLNSIVKPPSAELRFDQKDSDSLPDYDILDKILYQYIELRKGPRELEDAGFDSAIVKRVLKLVNTNEYKRHQTPPILRISPKAFGMGRRMPIVGKYLL